MVNAKIHFAIFTLYLNNMISSFLMTRGKAKSLNNMTKFESKKLGIKQYYFFKLKYTTYELINTTYCIVILFHANTLNVGIRSQIISH